MECEGYCWHQSSMSTCSFASRVAVAEMRLETGGRERLRVYGGLVERPVERERRVVAASRELE